MIVTESKIAAICQLRGISREEFDSSIAEKLGDGIYRLKESEFASVMQPVPVAFPSMFKRAGNFAASAARHVASGARRCTDEEIAARHEICTGCEHYDWKACRKCGCPVVRTRQWVSKLSWATESCPVGKWGPITREKTEVDGDTGPATLD
jgi:hypothetical protein